MSLYPASIESMSKQSVLAPSERASPKNRAARPAKPILLEIPSKVDIITVELEQLQRQFFRTVLVLALVACSITAVAIWAQLALDPWAGPLFGLAIVSCAGCGYLAIRKLQSLQHLALMLSAQTRR